MAIIVFPPEQGFGILYPIFFKISAINLFYNTINFLYWEIILMGLLGAGWWFAKIKKKP